MAIDLSRVIQAATQAASEEGPARQQSQGRSETRKGKGFSAPRAFLIGAGVMTAGRLALRARDSDLLDNLRLRLAEYEDKLPASAKDVLPDGVLDGSDQEEPEDEYDEPEDDEYDEPEGEYDDEYEDEPEGEYDESEEEYEDEPEDEYDEYDEPEDDEYDEPEDEYEDEPEDDEYDEPDQRPKRRPRAGSGGRARRPRR